MKNILIGIAVSIVGIILSLLLIEGGFRLFTHLKSPAETWTDRPEFYYKAAQSEQCQDYKYPPKKEGIYRIAVIGDSFTFATSMQFDDSFPKKLERMLNLNNEQKVEVLNYGVPGFSANHEADLTRKVIKEGADLVLLQVTLNDPQLKRYLPTGITGVNEFGAYVPDDKAKKLSHWWKSLGFVLERLHNNSTHKRYVKYYFDLFERQAEWQHFRRAIRQISSRTKKNNVQVAAVLFPLFGLPLDEDYPFLPLHEKVNKVLEKNSIPGLDLFDTFKGLPLARIQVEPGQDFHPNEIGHRLAAESIYKWLEALDLIPEGAKIKDKYRLRLNTDCSKNKPF